jgi:hypothetical protein
VIFALCSVLFVYAAYFLGAAAFSRSVAVWHFVGMGTLVLVLAVLAGLAGHTVNAAVGAGFALGCFGVFLVYRKEEV